MEVVSDILGSLRLKGEIAIREGGDAGLWAPAANELCFHLADRGGFEVIDSGTGERVGVDEGGIALVTGGTLHLIVASPFVQRVSGRFAMEARERHPLVEQLPALVAIAAQEVDRFAWLRNAIRFSAHRGSGEAGADDMPGGDGVINRLGEILFIEVLTRRIENEGDTGDFVRAAADRRIARALSAMHSRPERDWTVGALAAEAAMSRTSFAERFTALVGSAPLHYLRAWRLQTAARLLADGRAAAEDVAARVGYGSQRALARALRRETGQTLGAFRTRVPG